MFDESNVRNSLLNNYYYLATASKLRMKSNDVIPIIKFVLVETNNKLDSFNKDELIVVKNILYLSKYMINELGSYQIVSKESINELVNIHSKIYKSLSK